MAEERTDNQLKSEKTEPEDVDDKANHDERLTIKKVPPKIHSRYLSAQKSSCHDLCKYGIPHAVDAKACKRVTKRGRKTKVSQQNNVTSLDEPSKESSKSQTNREIVKNKSHSDSSSRKETESRNKQKKKTSLTGGKEKPTSTSLPLSSKHNFKKPSSLSSKSDKNMTRESSLKPRENVKEEFKPELANSDDLPDNILHVTEPASENSSQEPTVACDCDETKLSSPSSSSSGDKGLEHTDKKSGKSASSSSSKDLGSVAGNKGKVNMHSVSPVSISNTSPRKKNNAAFKSNKRGHDNQGENVKTVYKIRQKMSTKVGGANKAVVAARKLNFKRGKVIELQPQSNNVPRRLKFRPARILGDDMQRDMNGARKRTIVDNEVGSDDGDGNDEGDGEVNAVNTKSEKAVAKLQTVEGSKRRLVWMKVGGDRSKIKGSESGSDEKVILRHQSVEGKKQNPRLYNNVIEETATMLAELRKSKVKALVGAFETVISLDSPREATAAEASTTIC